MRNLLYLINKIFFLIIFVSCHSTNNNIQTKNQITVEKEKQEKNFINVDTSKSLQNSDTFNLFVTPNDTLNNSTKYTAMGKKLVIEAPVHNSPNQTKIDSIKNAKEKLKN